MKKIYVIGCLLMALFTSTTSFAQEYYIGDIKLFAGNFEIRGWAFCNGQLLAISDYDALFSIIGTTYGGDGQTTFALPDFRGRVPVGFSSTHPLGELGGTETKTLTIDNMPSHSHMASIAVNSGNATTSVPTVGSSIATSGTYSGRQFMPNLLYTTNAPDVLIDTVTTNTQGSATPINIIKPYCGLNYMIALDGIYPSRN